MTITADPLTDSPDQLDQLDQLDPAEVDEFGPPAEPEPVDQAATPGAPWGINPNTNEPYKRDPNIYARREARKKGGRRVPPAPKKAAGKAPRPPQRPPGRPDYRPGIVGLVSVPVGLLGALGGTLGRPELIADAATLATAAPALADVVQTMADQEPRVAAVLEWAVAAGPYGALISAVVPVAAQLAANHGLIKPGMLGTKAPAEIVDEFVARQSGNA